MDKNQIKILIIEDDLIILENLKENLLELGYQDVMMASNFDEAKQKFISANPDICLVDIHLGSDERDGIALMKTLNQESKIPFIYLTSFADKDTRDRAKVTNPSGYLIKPASKTQIDVSIDMAMNNFYNKSGATTHHNVSCPLFTNNGYFFIKVAERYEKIHLRDITYLQASGSYCQIHSTYKTYMPSHNLSTLLDQIKNKEIVRAHRSFAVNLDHLQAFDQHGLYINSGDQIIEIPIGEQYRAELMKHLPKIKV